MRIFKRLWAKTVAGLIAVCLWMTPVFPKDTIEVVPRGNWGAVEFLEKGTSISISMNSGDKMEGKFLGLEPDAIRLKVDKQERIYPRASITEIRQLRIPDGNLNGVLIGMGTGLLAGTLVARAGGTLNTGDTAARELGGAIITAGFALGAVLGGVIDSRIKGSKLIYLK